MQSEKVNKELETCKNQIWAKDRALEVSCMCLISRVNIQDKFYTRTLNIDCQKSVRCVDVFIVINIYFFFQHLYNLMWNIWNQVGL